MSKQKIKGLSAFALLDGLDDGMILSASLPEAAPAPIPTKGERIAAFFGRMGKGGMAAAIATMAVALAVLTGVMLAGRIGTLTPSGTDTNHGIHGSQVSTGGADATDGTENGVIAPPLDQSPEQEKGVVAVVSDGITVYPKGYCVFVSMSYVDDNGEVVCLDGDGPGAAYRLGEIKDELPQMRTAGNSYSLSLPEHMSLRKIRVFEIISIEGDGVFEEMALPAGAESATDVLKSVCSRDGTYIVVLDIYHETHRSQNEYTKGLDEYAFLLTVDPSMNFTAPVRVMQGDKTYFPTGYLLEESYYDAELKQEVTKQYDGATHQLQALIPDMVTATVIRRDSVTAEDALSLYLAPFYDLREITVYDANLDEIAKDQTTEALEILYAWGTGDYYVVISAVFAGTGATTVTEFPIHIKVVEKTEEDTYPNDVGETPDAPRVHVSTDFGSLYFGNTSHSAEYHEGYMLWTEQWYDGGMVSGDGFGASGQLAEISDSLPTVSLDAGGSVNIRLPYAEDTLIRMYIYYEDHSFYADAEEASVLGSLPAGNYIVVLRVETQGDYIAEADAYERTCTEYAFWLAVYEPAPPSGEPVDVTVGSEFILPYSIQVSVQEWTGSKFDGWTAMLEHLSSFADEIPTAEYTATTRVRVSSDHVLKSFEIWNADFHFVKNEELNEYTALDDLHAALDQLSPGTYYLVLKAVKYGQYVESHHLREEWVTNYYVALRVS